MELKKKIVEFRISISEYSLCGFLFQKKQFSLKFWDQSGTKKTF